MLANRIITTMNYMWELLQLHLHNGKILIRNRYLTLVSETNYLQNIHKVTLADNVDHYTPIAKCLFL